jgi:hypothetical protein
MLVSPSSKATTWEETSRTTSRQLEILNARPGFQRGASRHQKKLKKRNHKEYQIELQSFLPPNRLVWIFEAKLESYLKGKIKDEDQKILRKLRLKKDPPSKVRAVFKASHKDIVFEGSAGLTLIKLLGQDFLGTKAMDLRGLSAIVERKFLMHELNRIFEPYLSYQELQYE